MGVVRIFGIITLVLLAGCSDSVKTFICDTGYNAITEGQFSFGIKLLDQCLEFEGLSKDRKSNSYQAKAWGHYNLQNDTLAVQDQEKAFSLVVPTQHHEFINYGSYLRRVKRFEDSLASLQAAAVLDQLSGHPSMQTQYNLGWTLYELGRYDEAIDELTKGIPEQPDYPFVYLRRGLSFHRLSQSSKAESDFRKYNSLIGTSKMDLPDKFRKEINNVFKEYNLYDADS